MGRPLAQAATAGLVCMAVVPALLPEVVVSPGHHLWGAERADTLGLVWTLWHVAAHLFEHGTLGLHSQLAGFPDGGALWPANPVEAALAAPLTRAAGATVAFNALQVLHLGLAGAAGWLLGWRVHRASAAGWVVGVGFGLGPVLLCSAHNGNVEVGQLYLVPLALLAAWEARGASPAKAALAGAVAGLVVVAHVYLGVMAGISGALLLWVAPGPARARGLRLVAWGLGALAVASGPMAVAWSLTTGETALVRKGHGTVQHMRRLEGQVPLLRLLVPAARVAATPRGEPGPFLNACSPGLVVTIAAAWAVWRRPTASARPWGAVAVAGLVLCLGPTLILWEAPVAVAGRLIPLPYALLDHAPPLSMFIELWRFVALLQLALLVVAAGAVARRPGMAAALAGLIAAESLLLNPGPAAFESTAVPATALELTFAEAEPGGAVMVYPLGRHLWPLWSQTVHGRPVALSPDTISDPDLMGVLSGPEPTVAKLVERARAKGYRWLLVHADKPVEPSPAADGVVADAQRSGALVAVHGPFALIDLETEADWSATPLQVDR